MLKPETTFALTGGLVCLLFVAPLVLELGGFQNYLLGITLAFSALLTFSAWLGRIVIRYSLAALRWKILCFGVVSAIASLAILATSFGVGNLITDVLRDGDLSGYRFRWEFRDWVLKPLGLALAFGSVPAALLGIVYGLFRHSESTDA